MYLSCPISFSQLRLLRLQPVSIRLLKTTFSSKVKKDRPEKVFLAKDKKVPIFIKKSPKNSLLDQNIDFYPKFVRSCWTKSCWTIVHVGPKQNLKKGKSFGPTWPLVQHDLLSNMTQIVQLDSPTWPYPEKWHALCRFVSRGFSNRSCGEVFLEKWMNFYDKKFALSATPCTLWRARKSHEILTRVR